MDGEIRGKFDRATRNYGRGSSPKQEVLNELNTEKQEKYDEIGRLQNYVDALNAEISQKNGILRTMTGRDMAAAYASLDEEIAGLVREKKAEQEAIANLRSEIDTIKEQIKQVKSNW